MSDIFYKLFAVAQFTYLGFVLLNLGAFTSSIFKVHLKKADISPDNFLLTAYKYVFYQCDVIEDLSTNDPALQRSFLDKKSSLEKPLSSRMCINVILMSLFCIQHSTMARSFFKKNIFPTDVKFERAFYVFMTSLTIHCYMHFWQPMPDVIYEVKDETTLTVLICLNVFGYAFLMGALFQFDFFHFMGLKQPFSSEEPNFDFVIAGFYAIVRHPIYLGFLFTHWCNPILTQGQLLHSVMMSTYMLGAALFLEEPDLVECIGPEYIDYTHKMPAFCPLRANGCYCSRSKMESKKKVHKKD